MLRSFALRGLLPRDRRRARGAPASSGGSTDPNVYSMVARLQKGHDDGQAPAPLARELLREAAHGAGCDQDDSVPVCRVPDCGKPTWNGRAGEYCSVACQHSMPQCKRPGCSKPTWNGKPHGYCSMACKNVSTLCLQPSCSKTTFNGRPHGFCSMACFEDAEPVCMMHGCGKKTWNGRPAGYCSTECRDASQKMMPKRGLSKGRKELEKQISHLVAGKLSNLDHEQQALEDENIEQAKAKLLNAQSGKDLLLTAELCINENWLEKAEALPGNIYRIAAFGRISGCGYGNMRMVVPKVMGWVLVWLLQVGGPPAIFLSSFLGWGIKCESYINWWAWTVDFKDWNHIGLTKALGVLFQLVFILNGLFVVQADWDAWNKVKLIVQYMMHHNKNVRLPLRWILYVGILTNCWVVLWCCLDTIVVLGFSDSPKDVVFDALGLLFLYNLDDVGSELGFVKEADWPGARLGWIYSEMAEVDWQPVGGPSDEDEKVEKLDESRTSCCKCRVASLLIGLTVWMLRLACLLFPAFSTITSFTELPHVGNSTCLQSWRLAQLGNIASQIGGSYMSS